RRKGESSVSMLTDCPLCVKHQIEARWFSRPGPEGRGLAVITDGGNDDVFAVEQLLGDVDGHELLQVVGYRLTGHDGTDCDVMADPWRCDCGRACCVHIETLRQLVDGLAEDIPF